jgi:hypothetical protein
MQHPLASPAILLAVKKANPNRINYKRQRFIPVIKATSFCDLYA